MLAIWIGLPAQGNLLANLPIMELPITVVKQAFVPITAAGQRWLLTILPWHPLRQASSFYPADFVLITSLILNPLFSSLPDCPVQQLNNRISVPEFDDIQCGEILINSEYVLKRDTQDVAEDYPVDTSMGNHCHVFACV